MRFLIITQKIDQRDPVLGFFHRWLEEFAHRSDSIIALCLETGEYHLPANVQVWSLGKENKISRLRYLWRFYNLIWRERQNYDAVFVHMNQVYVLLGAWLWRWWGKKIGLWYAHGSVSWTLKLAEKLTDIVFTSTPSGFRLTSRKLRIVGQGIDTEKFQPSKNRQAAEAFKLITVSRLSPIKDIETLLRAVVILRDQGKSLSLEIVGGTETEGQKQYLKHLKKFVSSNHLEEIVKFYGPASNDQIAAQLPQANLFVNASRTGSLDKAILEAMAAGVPILTSNEAIKSILTDKDLNLSFFSMGQAADLAEKIKGFISLKEKEREQLIQHFRQIVVSDHNVVNLIKKITEAYGQIDFREKYNDLIEGKYQHHYEEGRWFKTEVQKAGYEMTKATIEQLVINGSFLSFKNCLELGPGPGTWTKLLLSKNPDANYDLVDISSAMLDLAKKALTNYSKIRFFESDFLTFKPDRQYDFFFSSRAFEYLPNKETAVVKISDLLAENGQGLVITKTPKYFAYHLMRRSIPAMHRGQIKPKDLVKLLSRHDLKVTAIYPATFSFPFFRRASLNRWLFKVLAHFPLNIFTQLLTESYAVRFIKK